jgi:hypothetical protein
MRRAIREWMPRRRNWSWSNTPPLAQSSSRGQQLVAEPQPNFLAASRLQGGGGSGADDERGDTGTVWDAARNATTGTGWGGGSSAGEQEAEPTQPLIVLSEEPPEVLVGPHASSF